MAARALKNRVKAFEQHRVLTIRKVYYFEQVQIHQGKQEFRKCGALMALIKKMPALLNQIEESGQPVDDKLIPPALPGYAQREQQTPSQPAAAKTKPSPAGSDNKHVNESKAGKAAGPVVAEKKVEYKQVVADLEQKDHLQYNKLILHVRKGLDVLSKQISELAGNASAVKQFQAIHTETKATLNKLEKAREKKLRIVKYVQEKREVQVEQLNEGIDENTMEISLGSMSMVSNPNNPKAGP